MADTARKRLLAVSSGGLFNMFGNIFRHRDARRHRRNDRPFNGALILCRHSCAGGDPELSGAGGDIKRVELKNLRTGASLMTTQSSPIITEKVILAAGH